MRCGILEPGFVRARCDLASDAPNLDVHFLSLVLGGVHAQSEGGALRVHPLSLS